MTTFFEKVLVKEGVAYFRISLYFEIFLPSAKAVPHVCAGPPEGFNWTDVFDDPGNLSVVREECKMLLKNNSSVQDTTTCVYGVEYELPRDASVVSQVEDYSFATISISRTALFCHPAIKSVRLSDLSLKF